MIHGSSPLKPPLLLTNPSIHSMKQMHTFKMVSGFRRSISFPAHLSPRSSPVNPTRRHLRSISLPCLLHPLLSHMDSDLQMFNSWLLQQPSDSIDGLCKIDHLLSSLNDFLHLSTTQDALRGAWADRLLDDFLRLADAYGTFRLSIVSLRQLQSATHVAATHAAIRRRDETQLASCLRSQRRAEKEMTQLAAEVKDVMRQDRAPALECNDAAVTPMAGIVRDVISVIAAASAAVFSGVAIASSATSAPVSRLSRCRMVGEVFGRRYGKEEGEKWRWGVMEKLEVVEECMVVMEEKSERVFRILVNARVSLLNLLTPSL